MITRNARAAQAIGMMLFFRMFLLSGAGPPRSVMSSAIETVSGVLPLTYVVGALQDPWLGEGHDVASLVRLAVMLVIALFAVLWIAGKKV